jgi:hypothetical protein
VVRGNQRSKPIKRVNATVLFTCKDPLNYNGDNSVIYSREISVFYVLLKSLKSFMETWNEFNSRYCRHHSHNKRSRYHKTYITYRLTFQLNVAV